MVDMEDDEDDDDLPDAADAQVHPFRVRILGLTASPGGGSTAVLFSRFSTVHPDRPCRTSIAFGCVPADRNTNREADMQPGLTTEGRMWEWMYGGGPEVPGFHTESRPPTTNSELEAVFGEILPTQQCVFCRTPLKLYSETYECEMRHSFGRLSAVA
jgi:hypothetical protein